MNAVIIKETECVKILLKHGAAVNKTDKARRTALEFPAHMDFTEIAAILLRKGTKVDAANRLGQTPLWAAANRGNLKAGQLLVKHGRRPM